MTCIARHFFLIVLIPMLFGTVRISLAQVAELCEQGFEEIDEGRLEDAVATFSEAMEEDPYRVEAWYGRGTAYLDLEEYELARADFNKALTLELDCPEALFGLARLHCSLGDFETAASLEEAE